MSIKSKTAGTLVAVAVAAGFGGIQYVGYRNAEMMKNAALNNPRIAKLIRDEHYTNIPDEQSFLKSRDNDSLMSRIVLPSYLREDAMNVCNEKKDMAPKVETVHIPIPNDTNKTFDYSAIKCEQK